MPTSKRPRPGARGPADSSRRTPARPRAPSLTPKAPKTPTRKTPVRRSQAKTAAGTSRRRSGRPGRAGRARRWLRRVLLVAAATLIVLVLTAGLAFFAFSRDLPDVNALRDLRPPQYNRILARDGTTLGAYGERRTLVPFSEIPRVMVLSMLAAEDADFYRHRGLDYPGLLRALFRSVMSGNRVRGTSTITQQLVKLTLLSPERTITRKIKELLLARRLEQAFSKDEILERYLNEVNFGRGRYGVQEAARYYFGVDAKDLNVAQASLLAGIPQSPSHLSPRAHPEAARRRQLFVLTQLAEKQAEYWPDLSLDEVRAAMEAPVTLVPEPQPVGLAPETVALARQELVSYVGADAARRGGYTVETSISPSLQRAARGALQKGLRDYDARKGVRGPFRPARGRTRRVARLRTGKTYRAQVVSAEGATLTLDIGGHRALLDLRREARYAPEAEAAFAPPRSRLPVSVVRFSGQEAHARLELGPEGAVVLIDPRTREVLACVGAYAPGHGFNRALRAVRQPGSTFKPFVYAAGLRSRRYTPATIVLDAPGVYDDWRPGNYETWSFQGEIRLREALARSINQVAVRVIEDVTPEVVAALARRSGIQTDLEPTLALALGASGVRPVELVNAYATFASGGRWAEPRLIKRIVGPDGRVVPLTRSEPSREVLSAAEAYVITDMLKSVVEAGTARRARALNREAAGKTGTSNEVRDAWFVGFTADLVAGVWVGYDDRRPLGRGESGSRTALPVWVDLMKRASAGRPARSFAMPPGVVVVPIDPRTGLLAYPNQPDAIDEVFLEGTAPTEVAPEPGVLDAGGFLMQQFGGTGGDPGAVSDSPVSDSPVSVSP